MWGNCKIAGLRAEPRYVIPVEHPKRIPFDLYYMKNLSIALDLLVIRKTVKTVHFQKRAREETIYSGKGIQY